MRNSSNPRIDVGAQANLDRLAALGVEVDPVSGKAKPIPGAFQGSMMPGDDPVPSESTGPDIQVVSRTHVISPFENRLDEELEPEVLPVPAETAVQPAPKEEPRKVGDGEQTPEGLAKREKDAREAQREYTKARLELEPIVKTIKEQQLVLDDKIQKLTALQAALGSVPPTMSPADQETIKRWREDESTREALSVMESLVAPVYSMLADMQSQMAGMDKRVGDFFGKIREKEVFGEVYSKIPEARVKAITESNEFLQWLSELPPTLQNTYVNIIEKTTAHSGADALKVLSIFSKDTGIDIGMNGSPVAPAPPAKRMDASPVLRSGSALPDPIEQPPQTPRSLENTPLSAAELQNYGQMVRNARTQEEVAILNKRLALSNLNFSGDATAQTLY